MEPIVTGMPRPSAAAQEAGARMERAVLYGDVTPVEPVLQPFRVVWQYADSQALWSVDLSAYSPHDAWTAVRFGICAEREAHVVAVVDLATMR